MGEIEPTVLELLVQMIQAQGSQITGLTDTVSELSGEVKFISANIRDYNHIRERLDKCEQRMDIQDGMISGQQESEKSRSDKIALVVSVAAIVIAAAGVVMPIIFGH